MEKLIGIYSISIMQKILPFYDSISILCVYVYYIHAINVCGWMCVRQDGRESTPGWNAERPMSKNVGKKDNAEDRNKKKGERAGKKSNEVKE